MMQIEKKEFDREIIYGPIEHPKMQNLIHKIQKMMTAIDYTGLLTFEVFEVGRELLVNEMIARTHFYGHALSDTFLIDQYEMYLRAVLNLDFPGSQKKSQSFLMLSLFGKSSRIPKMTGAPVGKLYWYEKKSNRLGRRMAYLNYTQGSLSRLKLLAQKDLKKFLL